jgi:hypothetical protein
MQKPSLGRQVRYHQNGQEFTATVCFVHSETCVNLSTIDHNGMHTPRTSVLLAEGELAEGRWSWPDFVKPVPTKLPGVGE